MRRKPFRTGRVERTPAQGSIELRCRMCLETEALFVSETQATQAT